jgi:hypothetical protein
MDVVSLLRFGWPYLKAEQRQVASAEIGKMLGGACGSQADGSFRQESGDDSIEEQTFACLYHRDHRGRRADSRYDLGDL